MPANVLKRRKSAKAGQTRDSELTQTLNFRFLYTRVSTLNPMARGKCVRPGLCLQIKYVLGTVETTSPSYKKDIVRVLGSAKMAVSRRTCSLYKRVVLPAPSRPRIRMRISLSPPQSEANTLPKTLPKQVMLAIILSHL